MIEVWSNGVVSGGRITDPAGTYGQTITAGTRTPNRSNAKPQ
jgi:hypothetical protein